MKAEFHSLIAAILDYLSWLPNWLAAVITLAILIAAALLIHKLVWRVLLHSRLGRGRIAGLALNRAEGPARAAFLTIGIGAAIPALGLDAAHREIFLRLDFAAFLLVIGWAGIAIVNLLGDIYVARLPHDFVQNALARKHVTQVRVLRQTAKVAIALLAVSAALMTQPAVEKFGVSLLASAGAAGLVVGLAARPVLSNLLAGIQIAITQPIKLEDAVIVENEWGWVEDITSTYVVIRCWDWRRMIVPLTNFLEKPFQNWTRETNSLIGSVLFYVDYTTPVEEIRQALDRIVRESKLWDENVVNLQVVDATEKAIQLRALVSARNAEQTWDLRCEVREKLIAFLQAGMPQALPRMRFESPPGFVPESRLQRVGRG